MACGEASARPDAPLGRWGIGRPSRCALSAGACRAYWYACIGTLALQLQPPFSRRRAGALDGAAPLASLHLEASLGVLEQWSLATVCVTAIASVPPLAWRRVPRARRVENTCPLNYSHIYV